MSAAPEDRLKAAIVHVTPFEQNCSLVWDEATKRGAMSSASSRPSRRSGSPSRRSC